MYKRQGLEIDVMGKPLPHLNITAGYSFNDMRFTETPSGKGNFIAGERLVNIPKQTANVIAQYFINEGILKHLSLGAGVHYTGEKKAGWNNTQGQAQAFSRTIELPSFTLVDAYLNYSYKKINLGAKLGNMFNVLNWTVHENYSVCLLYTSPSPRD